MNSAAICECRSVREECRRPKTSPYLIYLAAIWEAKVRFLARASFLGAALAHFELGGLNWRPEGVSTSCKIKKCSGKFQ